MNPLLKACFVLTALLLLGMSLSADIQAAEKQRMAFAVVCSDQVIADKVTAGISARFAKAGIEIDEEFPQGRLILFLSRDSNDRKNKEGISVAIAHVSNIATARLALEIIQVKKEPLPELLKSMLQEPGFLQHLNVAHLDEGSDTQIGLLLDSVVSDFLEKYPAPKNP